MNIVAYLQYFDGLAEKYEGTFEVCRKNSKTCQKTGSDKKDLYRCKLEFEDRSYVTGGHSRKDALRSLYRKLRTLR